jgi:hypothetical protein
VLRRQRVPLVLRAELHLDVVLVGVVLEALEEEDVVVALNLAATFALTLVSAHLSIA